MWASAMALIVPRQSFNIVGTSGNAHVVNVAGDCIMQDNDSFGAETRAVLESIEQRLKVVVDKEMGKSCFCAYYTPLS